MAAEPRAICRVEVTMALVSRKRVGSDSLAILAAFTLITRLAKDLLSHALLVHACACARVRASDLSVCVTSRSCLALVSFAPKGLRGLYGVEAM
eukprot:2855098-Amphidinium_carterae.1